jgi:hypothetical protein
MHSFDSPLLGIHRQWCAAGSMRLNPSPSLPRCVNGLLLFVEQTNTTKSKTSGGGATDPQLPFVQAAPTPPPLCPPQKSQGRPNEAGTFWINESGRFGPGQCRRSRSSRPGSIDRSIQRKKINNTTDAQIMRNGGLSSSAQSSSSSSPNLYLVGVLWPPSV